MRCSKGEEEVDDFCPKRLAVPSLTLFFNLIFTSVVISTAQRPTAKASLWLSDLLLTGQVQHTVSLSPQAHGLPCPDLAVSLPKKSQGCQGGIGSSAR